MAEPFIGTMYAMTAVFAAAVAVWFSIRAYRHARMVKQEEEVRGERAELG